MKSIYYSEISEGARVLHHQIFGVQENIPEITSLPKASTYCLTRNPGLFGYFAPTVKINQNS